MNYSREANEVCDNVRNISRYICIQVDRELEKAKQNPNLFMGDQIDVKNGSYPETKQDSVKAD